MKTVHDTTEGLQENLADVVETIQERVDQVTNATPSETKPRSFKKTFTRKSKKSREWQWKI